MTPWIAILGIDGSGKTTVIEGIRQKCEETGMNVIIPHWRPEYIKPGKEAGPVTNPHGHSPRGFIISILKLVFLLADWTIGFRCILSDKRARGWFVIFDRCYHDLLVDPIRYRYGAPLFLARFAFWFFPKPDALILLDAPAEILHARKPETTLEMARELREKYRIFIVKHPVGFIVDCSRPIQTVIKETADILEVVTKRHRSR